MGFNRNIIIQQDIDRLVDPNLPDPVTLTASPPSGYVATVAPARVGAPAAAHALVGATAAAGGGQADETQTAPGKVTVLSGDDYLTKLLKYVPVEVLAAYLFMAGVVNSNVSGRHDRAIWLGALLVGILVLTVPYDRVVLNVVRWEQTGMSLVGLAVYVFAVGGWFATTSWYHQWYASIVVPVFGLVVAILKLPPLPAGKSS